MIAKRSKVGSYYNFIDGKQESWNEEVVIWFKNDLEPGKYYVYSFIGNDEDNNKPATFEHSVRIYSDA